MHLRTLRYYVAVVDAGSLTAAAAAIPDPPDPRA
jgi:LysR family nitrogen assimilation transcriptional regulator